MFLAVVAVIAVLPLWRSRLHQGDVATTLQKRGRLYQIQVAVRMYSEHYGELPPLSTNPLDGGRGLSWRVLVLPFLGEQALYSQFDIASSWDSPVNARLLDKMPEHLFGVAGSSAPGTTNIMAVTDNNNWLYSTNPDGVYTDGSGKSLSLCACSGVVMWTFPADASVNSTQRPVAMGTRNQRECACITADGTSVEKIFGR
jgi:hypothetical protein